MAEQQAAPGSGRFWQQLGAGGQHLWWELAQSGCAAVFLTRMTVIAEHIHVRRRGQDARVEDADTLLRGSGVDLYLSQPSTYQTSASLLHGTMALVSAPLPTMETVLALFDAATACRCGGDHHGAAAARLAPRPAGADTTVQLLKKYMTRASKKLGSLRYCVVALVCAAFQNLEGAGTDLAPLCGKVQDALDTQGELGRTQITAHAVLHLLGQAPCVAAVIGVVARCLRLESFAQAGGDTIFRARAEAYDPMMVALFMYARLRYPLQSKEALARITKNGGSAPAPACDACLLNPFATGLCGVCLAATRPHPRYPPDVDDPSILPLGSMDAIPPRNTKHRFVCDLNKYRPGPPTIFTTLNLPDELDAVARLGLHYMHLGKDRRGTPTVVESDSPLVVVRVIAGDEHLRSLDLTATPPITTEGSALPQPDREWSCPVVPLSERPSDVAVHKSVLFYMGVFQQARRTGPAASCTEPAAMRPGDQEGELLSTVKVDVQPRLHLMAKTVVPRRVSAPAAMRIERDTALPRFGHDLGPGQFPVYVLVSSLQHHHRDSHAPEPRTHGEGVAIAREGLRYKHGVVPSRRDVRMLMRFAQHPGLFSNSLARFAVYACTGQLFIPPRGEETVGALRRILGDSGFAVSETSTDATRRGAIYLADQDGCTKFVWVPDRTQLPALAACCGPPNQFLRITAWTPGGAPLQLWAVMDCRYQAQRAVHPAAWDSSDQGEDPAPTNRGAGDASGGDRSAELTSAGCDQAGGAETDCVQRVNHSEQAPGGNQVRVLGADAAATHAAPGLTHAGARDVTEGHRASRQLNRPSNEMARCQELGASRPRARKRLRTGSGGASGMAVDRDGRSLDHESICAGQDGQDGNAAPTAAATRPTPSAPGKRGRGRSKRSQDQSAPQIEDLLAAAVAVDGLGGVR